MKPILVAVTLLAAFAAFGQKSPKNAARVRPKAPASAAPVSQVEAAAALRRVAEVMKNVLHLSSELPSFASGSGVASRERIVKNFSTLYDLVEPKFTLTLPKIAAKPGIITLKDLQSRQLAEKLEVLGFIDRYGPLLTSKTEGLSTSEFGDAIAAFIARTAEMTHTPTRKFSPYLMPP